MCVKFISASVMRDDNESPKPRSKAELTYVTLEESSTCLSRTPDPQLATSGQTGITHPHTHSIYWTVCKPHSCCGLQNPSADFSSLHTQLLMGSPWVWPEARSSLPEPQSYRPTSWISFAPWLHCTQTCKMHTSRKHTTPPPPPSTQKVLPI